MESARSRYSASMSLVHRWCMNQREAHDQGYPEWSSLHQWNGRCGRRSQFLYVGGVDWLGDAGSATPRFELVGRSEQWLTGHNVHVDTRFFVVEIFASAGRFGAV